MVGVPAQVGAFVRARVEVPDALVVGEERDPPVDEHRAGEMAAELGDQLPAVQPDTAHGPAPVALPGGRFVRWGAGEQQGLPLALDVGDADVRDRAPGLFAAGVAVGGDGVGPGEVGEGLAVRGDGEDVAFGGPAAHLGVGAAPVGEPVARSAVHRRQVDLRDEAPPARVRDPPAVGGETGVADLGAVDGEPPGAPAAVERGQPQVVLGDEAQPVAAQMRETQIAGGVLVRGRVLVLVAHLPMLFRWSDPGNSWRRGRVVGRGRGRGYGRCAWGAFRNERAPHRLGPRTGSRPASVRAPHQLPPHPSPVVTRPRS